MKKIIALVLLAVMLMSLFTTSAMADPADTTNYAFGYSASTNGSTLRAANQHHFKKDDKRDYIEVRHTVSGSGSGAGHTNYMYAYKVAAQQYVGAKWQAPNGIYYCCTSSSLKTVNLKVTPGGRANTKYAEQQGLSNIQLDGQFRVH